MTIPHVPSNPEGIAYASEQNALIDQCNSTATTAARHNDTLTDHATRLATLEAAPPAHTHPIGQVTGLRDQLDDHSSRLTALETAPAPKLDDLSDVDTADATDGQVLKFSGGTWTPADDNAGTGGGATKLGDLDDVTTDDAVAGQVLKFTGTRWAPGTDNTADGGTGATRLDELTDVTTTGATTGQALVYSAGTWSPAAPAPAAHTHPIANVSGLRDALDAKATTSSVDNLADRLTALETTAPSLVPTTTSDTLLYGDVISSHRRTDCQWGESLSNGYMTAAATRSAKDLTAVELRISVVASAAGSGTFDLKLYTGPSLSTLAERFFTWGVDKVNTTGVKHIPLAEPLTINAGDYVAVCMIATGWTTAPKLSSTPTGTGAQVLINEQPYSVYQAGQAYPPPTALDMTASKWTRSNQLFWFALA